MVRAATIRSAAIGVAVVLLLAGCGRRGPLEPPLGSPQTQTPASALADQARVSPNTESPGMIQNPNTGYEQSAIARLNSGSRTPPARPINAPPQNTPNAFFLDPLVK